jgi:hypothetical protein
VQPLVFIVSPQSKAAQQCRTPKRGRNRYTWVLVSAQIILKPESACAVETTAGVLERPLRFRKKFPS